MTDQHPLTDEMCEGLMERTSKYPYTDDVIVDMRAAADWQLEQDSEAWKIILNRMKILHPLIVDSIIEEFKKAMRPQEES